MTARLAAVLVAGAALRAGACPELDFDEVAAGGPTVVESGSGPTRLWIRAVPSRPSVYWHHGADSSEPPPTFTDDDGRVIPYVPVYTGIPSYPFRLDLWIDAGTVTISTTDHTRYEVEPGMTPHTRSVKVEPWNGYNVITVDSDAALLRYDVDGATWFESNWPPAFTRYFETNDVTITALYADRRSEVIFDGTGCD